MIVSISAGLAYGQPQSLPKPLVRTLRNATYYEEYLAQVLRPLRQLPGSKNSLSQADLDEMQKVREAVVRASQIQRILAADLDGDGKVTRKEVEAYAVTQRNSSAEQVTLLMQFDTDDNHVITYEEMRVLPKGAMAIRQDSELTELLTLDNDKDGTLTLEELKKAADDAFNSLDTNKDGKLSPDEKTVLVASYDSIVLAPLTPLDLPPETEIHAVGIYEPQVTMPNGGVRAPVVDVRVSRPNKKVALLLTSYEPVKWKVTADGKTQIVKIAYAKTSQNGASSKVILNDKETPIAVAADMHYTYSTEGKNFRQLLAYVKSATGYGGLASFSGAYRAPLQGFDITEVSTDTELKKDRLVPVAAEALPKFTFPAMIAGVPGTYSLSGKLDKPLPAALVTAAYAPDEKMYYGLTSKGIRRLDAAGKELEDIPASLDVPVFSWANSVTYNPKGGAIIVNSVGGEGFLYSYHLKKRAWSAVNLNNLDVQNLQYDKKTGGYIASGIFRAEDLYHLDSSGKVVKKEGIELKKFVGLTDTYDLGNESAPNLRLIPVKDYLVVVVGQGKSMDSNPSSAQRIYLYNRKTGEVQLTYAVP